MISTAHTDQGFTTRLTVRDHELLADEPGPEGGDDLGPTPVELLLASLGACTTITARMYADRKGFEVDSIIALAKLEQTEPGTPAKIVLDIDVRGGLSSDERQRVIDIAARCPVHRMLEHPVEVETMALQSEC